jgi:D-2-hydroxyacid dehydrogenase (NADP+)
MTGKILFLECERPTDLDIYRQAVTDAVPGLEIVTAETEAEAVAKGLGATALVAKAHNVTAALIAAMPRLDWIQALTTGTDHLDTLDLPPSVTVTSARGIHGPQMSELAFMYMLAFSRDFAGMLDNQRKAEWQRWPQKLLLGKTAVIVGVGTISEELAQRCKVFGMRTIGVSGSRPSAPGFDQIVGRDRLHEVAAQADFLIVLAPHTPENHHLIDAGVLASMAAHAVLINLARGKLCDEDALIQALAERRIAGAALDVFSVEPLPADSPLWRMDNVIITPHIGGLSDSYALQLLPLVVDNVRAYSAGDRTGLRNVVKRG